MDRKNENSYCKNNRIRTKLLLFIDNEIQIKIKQNKQNLKFNCEEKSQIQITFEETFSQKEIEKYGFSSSNITKTKKNDNSDKSFSTVDNSSNKNKKKSKQKERGINHPKTFVKEDNLPNKLLNNVCFHKKIYTIKNLSKQSSTFLILIKKKIGAKYLKNLCYNLKVCKNDKKPVKQCESINIKSKLLSLTKDKKAPKNSNKLIIPKSQKSNICSTSLFKKQQKENFIINTKRRNYGKSSHSLLIKFKSKE